MDHRNLPRTTRLAVLRAGYGAIIFLLVFSTVEAYRVHDTVSEKHVETYQRYIAREDALSRLRRNILLSSNYVRDFFLSTRPDRAAVLQAELRELNAQNHEALAKLAQPGTNHRGQQTVRAAVEEYCKVLEPVPSKATVSVSEAYDFLQREVVPRRTAAYTSLRQMTEVYQGELQQQLTDLARSRRAAVRRLALVLAVCVVLSVFVAWLSMRHAANLEREMIRQYQEVAQAKLDLQDLSARLLEIQEEERRRLSRGLHDEIGQTLTALRIEISHALAKAATPDVRERLERARGLAERTVQTVRDISLVLRPALLDDLGLVPALQWQLEDFSRRSGIRCEFTERTVEDVLPDAVKTCVYRVVQEALNNCEKHASATAIEVSIAQAGDWLTVEMRDNGRGVELNALGMPARSQGTGMFGMRERAVRLGGTLTVESEPNRGTRLLLRVPVPGARAGSRATADGAEA